MSNVFNACDLAQIEKCQGPTELETLGDGIPFHSNIGMPTLYVLWFRETLDASKASCVEPILDSPPRVSCSERRAALSASAIWTQFALHVVSDTRLETGCLHQCEGVPTEHSVQLIDFFLSVEADRNRSFAKRRRCRRRQRFLCD